MPELRGKKATTNEYNVGKALDTLGHRYEFQATPFGFQGIRGQYIVDFLIYNPGPIPLEVFGEYWHTGELGADDLLRLAVIEKYYGQPAIIIWGRESETEENAIESVRMKVGEAII